MKNLIFAIIISSLLAGCASLTVTGAVVPIGETRPPVSESEVGIYTAAPANAIKVGTVEVVTTQSMTENTEVMGLVLPEFIKQAAAIGANGFITTKREVDLKTGHETHFADAIYVPRTKQGQ
jgi:hypothetical protein